MSSFLFSISTSMSSFLYSGRQRWNQYRYHLWCSSQWFRISKKEKDQNLNVNNEYFSCWMHIISGISIEQSICWLSCKFKSILTRYIAIKKLFIHIRHKLNFTKHRFIMTRQKRVSLKHRKHDKHKLNFNLGLLNTTTTMNRKRRDCCYLLPWRSDLLIHADLNSKN